MTARTATIELKSPREIQAMRRAGLVVWLAHQRAARLVRPGVTTAELNDAVREVFREAGAEPLFLNYPGPTPFPAEACISVNEELVHGIPGSRRLKEGDIVTVDTGCRLAGWCGDAAVTHAVGTISPGHRRLLEVTQATLHLAIERMATAARWSDVAAAMAERVRKAGFHTVTSMVGHGIGRQLHEPPQAPNLVTEDWKADGDFLLRPGLVLAIEPMVNAGTERLDCLADGWTQIAADRGYSAHFEHTLAITRSGIRRLTGPPEPAERDQLPEWLGPPGTWFDW